MGVVVLKVSIAFQYLGSMYELDGVIDENGTFKGTGRIHYGNTTYYFAQKLPYVYITTNLQRLQMLFDEDKMDWKWKLNRNVKNKWKDRFLEGAYVFHVTPEDRENNIFHLIDIVRLDLKSFKRPIRAGPVIKLKIQGKELIIRKRLDSYNFFIERYDLERGAIIEEKTFTKPKKSKKK